MATMTVEMPVLRDNQTEVQCVECGTVYQAKGLTAPCEHKISRVEAGESVVKRECGGLQFIPIHDCTTVMAVKDRCGPIPLLYQRKLKQRGWLPYHAEDELLRVIRNELQMNRPSVAYIREKAEALIRHVERGLAED
jgi:hypothetical protein